MDKSAIVHYRIFRDTGLPKKKPTVAKVSAGELIISAFSQMPVLNPISDISLMRMPGETLFRDVLADFIRRSLLREL